MPISIIRLLPEDLTTYFSELMTLLQDAVDSGASVGFLPPMNARENEAYWQGVFSDVKASSTLLFAALEQEKLVGSVQLILAQKLNANHRAEVAKLLVLTSQQRRGIGRALLEHLELEAKKLGRTTLTLDTRKDDHANALYKSLGYQLVGDIPNYFRNNDGKLRATTFYYKLL